MEKEGMHLVLLEGPVELNTYIELTHKLTDTHNRNMY